MFVFMDVASSRISHTQSETSGEDRKAGRLLKDVIRLLCNVYQLQVGEPSEDHHVMCRIEKVAAEFLRQLNEHAKKSECPPVRIDSILSVTIFILPGMKCHSFVDLVRIKFIEGRLLAKNAKKQTQASCVTK
ncbi:hypothetical protein Q1695_006894 [Nippostrongylus brasiliensis]|nr:hypothetical protein Q1695_006894 [Nippostrongylus brasiliensis]